MRRDSSGFLVEASATVYTAALPGQAGNCIDVKLMDMKQSACIGAYRP